MVQQMQASAGTYVITADDYTLMVTYAATTQVDGTGAAFVSLTAGGDGFAENETTL